MFDLNEFLRITFFSGCTCCCLCIIRSVTAKAEGTIFVSGCLAGAIFYIINMFGYVILAGFLSTAVACLVVRFFHDKGIHSYFTVIIPAIYCVAPGRPMFEMFFAMYNKDWQVMIRQGIYSIKIVIGCYLAILLVTGITNKFDKHKIPYLQQFKT